MPESSGAGFAMDGPAAVTDPSRRRIRRYSIAVPVDVVALRSGVPASIPGRTVNVSEGGLGTVLAGELSPGEPVGVEFRLPSLRETIQARAIVRHYSLMSCGLQFVGLPVEQANVLRTWTNMADHTAIAWNSSTVSRAPATAAPVSAPMRMAKPRPSHGLRWIFISASIVFLVLGAVAWWSWNAGWRDLEDFDASPSPAAAVAEVPSSVMAQRIIHRVDPIYPSEAIRKKIQGEVTVQATIGPDGVIRDVSAVDGPEVLRPAAVSAVKWWRFEPYRVDGILTPVHTTIAVDFRLER